MKIIIAEKPSYASTIANALKKNEGGFARKNGYMIGNKGNYIITWVFGHLFRLYTIEEYENIDSRVSFLILSIIPLILIIYIVFKKKLYNLNLKQRELDNKLYAKFNESFQNLDTIKINSWNNFELNKLENYFKKVKENFKILTVIESIFSSLLISLNIIINAFILIQGSIYIINESMTLGELVSLLGMVQFIIQPISMFMNILNEYQPTLAAYFRLNDEILSKPKEIQGNIHLTNINEISFENVSLELNSKLILNNINFKFKKGNIYCIKGKNGIGKSTISKLLLKLYQTYDGNILIDNFNLKKIDTSSLHQLVSLVEQKTKIFNETIKDNLFYGNTSTDIKIINNSFEYIYKSMYNFPNGLDTILNNSNMLNISGGELQKIGLLRGLLKNSEVIILDEPTNSMDLETINHMIDILNSIKENKIIVIITHSDLNEYNLNITDYIYL